MQRNKMADMELEKDRMDNGLRDLLRSLPAVKPDPGMNARIMERVRTGKSPAEQRSNRNILIWAIALSAMILGIGVWALYFYIDWSFLSTASSSSGFEMTEVFSREVSRFTEGIFSSERVRMIETLLPFGGITLLLLVVDTLLRRRFFKRRHESRH